MRMGIFSIRHKTIIAMLAVYLFMAASMAGSYYLMLQLEKKIDLLEVIGRLEESVLEIRRFEKNYLLYGDSQSLNTARHHLGRVGELVENNRKSLEALSSMGKTDSFSKHVDKYEQMIGACLVAGKSDANDQRRTQETDLRTTGSAISEFAESLARGKRASIRSTIDSTVKLQLLTFIFVGIGLVSVGAFVSLKVLRPLRLVEKSTNDIAKGQFTPISTLPPEKELRDIFDSFNRMAATLKIREEQLVQSKKLASLGTMLAGVAHEVNNPLSNISSSCEILLEELDAGDLEWQRSLLKRVVEQVDKARMIVLNLLEFSRNKEFAKNDLNIKQLIERTLGLLKGQIPPNVEVVLSVPDSLCVSADAQRMQQVLLNLIQNAVHSIEGEGKVVIQAQDPRDGMLNLQIEDTGKGIEEEDLAKIFDPFFTTKDVGQGTGLGLFITHDIVVRHGGTISVMSKVGKGTTFTLSIPTRECPL